MNEKPEALRLAEWSERFCRNVKDPKDFRWKHMAEAATELRRLHAANLDCMAWYEVAKSQRDELLEALREVFSLDASLIRDIYGSEFVDRARAAIAKTGGAA